MRVSSLFRQLMALVIVGVSVFVVTGCQGEDKPAPLPNVPPATAPADAKATPASPTTGKAAGSASSGARQPRFGETPAK